MNFPRWTHRLVAASLGLLAGIAVVGVLEGEAQAGCNPACRNGDICRYEAAGGHYYCAPPLRPRRVQGTGRSRSATATPTTPLPGVAPPPPPGTAAGAH